MLSVPELACWPHDMMVVSHRQPPSATVSHRLQELPNPTSNFNVGKLVGRAGTDTLTEIPQKRVSQAQWDWRRDLTFTTPSLPVLWFKVCEVQRGRILHYGFKTRIKGEHLQKNDAFCVDFLCIYSLTRDSTRLDLARRRGRLHSFLQVTSRCRGGHYQNI